MQIRLEERTWKDSTVFFPVPHGIAARRSLNPMRVWYRTRRRKRILAEFSLSVSLLIVIFGLGHLCNYLIWRTNCSLSRRHSDPAIVVYKCMSTRIAICLSPIRFYTILHVNTCLAINSRSCQASVNLLSFAFYNGAYLSRNSFPSSGLSTLRNKRKTTKKGNGKTTSKFSDGNWVSLLNPFDLQLGALCDRPEVHNLELVRRNHDIAICLSPWIRE